MLPRPGPAALVLGVLACPGAFSLHAAPPAFGGGAIGDRPPVAACLSGAERALAVASLAGGPAPLAETATAPAPYPFFPQAGTLGQDLFLLNYVDLDPGPGLRDWDCGDWTYDNHQGQDSDIAGFRQQAIGVPVFAALDGRVAGTHDGEPDMNTTWPSVPANYVILDHGGTHQTYYWHLRKGSVAVSVGQLVAAGTQLGLTGSSGSSTGPHLHFESRWQGIWYEPSAGACRPGTSGWARQAAVDRRLALRELAFSRESYGSHAPLPFDDAPRTGTFLVGTRTISMRVQLGGLPEHALYRIRAVRPDGSDAADVSGPFGNDASMRASWWWWDLDAALDASGPWRVVLEVNGETLAEAPILVVGRASEIVNRAPARVSAVLDPPHPTAEDAVFCRVSTDILHRDPDYDVVSYRYVWKRNEATVRDVRTAALADAVPRGTLTSGGVLTCTVTPWDGAREAAPFTASSADGLRSQAPDAVDGAPLPRERRPGARSQPPR